MSILLNSTYQRPEIVLKTLKDNLWASLVIIYTRYLLGGAFVFASLIKIKGKRFTTESGADAPIDTAFHLLETFYQSGMYWKFIGWSQLIIGGLLMTQHFARLGAVANFPLIFNIFLITVAYNFQGTYFITGAMVLANLMLLLWEWDRLKVFFNLPSEPLNSPIESHQVWTIAGILLFTFTAGYRIAVDAYNILLWFGVCAIIGLGAFGYYMLRGKRDE